MTAGAGDTVRKECCPRWRRGVGSQAGIATEAPTCSPSSAPLEANATWAGYWIGYLAAWSQDADWPGQIGGGSGAIVPSIGASVLFVFLAGVLVFLLPERGVRRMLESGAPAQATW